MKGLALTVIVLMTIGIVSLLVLLMFFTDFFPQMLTDTFCFFNNHVFVFFGVNLGEELCRSIACSGERVVLEPYTTEQLTAQIAAYSILCLDKKVPSCGNSSICYELLLKREVGKVTEINLTEYLMEEGACHILENNESINETGGFVSMDCGNDDILYWDVENYFISNQKIILIQYDIINNRIVVKA